MRALVVLALFCCPLLAQAAPTAAQQQQLCAAAATDDAFGPLMDKFIGEKTLSYQDAGAVLSLDCGNGQFLLGVMVEGMSAENLEYAVIDMGVNVDEPLVQHDGQALSISQYLRDVAARKSASAAGFATGYLKNFHDPAFNPMLNRFSMN